MFKRNKNRNWVAGVMVHKIGKKIDKSVKKTNTQEVELSKLDN